MTQWRDAARLRPPMLYILDGHKPKPWSGSFHDFTHWFATANRRVAYDAVRGSEISTVFLGIGWSDKSLFETMIFGGPFDKYQTRASTWDEAEQQHAEAVRLVRAGKMKRKSANDGN